MMVREIAPFPALSIAGLQSLARQLATRLRAGDVIALRGDVGAGKTTFARALIGAIATGHPDVTSPTFNLMQSYDVALRDGPHTLWHLDLYRLKRADEAEALGLRELWSAVALIEWPERIENLLPAGRLDIRFDFTASQETRTLTMHGNDAWRSRLETIE